MVTRHATGCLVPRSRPIVNHYDRMHGVKVQGANGCIADQIIQLGKHTWRCSRGISDPTGLPLYNWTLLDKLYDGILAAGVKPIVELSFMPGVHLPFLPNACLQG
jgi:hypothetical protein